MKMSDKTYKKIKWIVQIVLPSLITLYGTIGATLQIPHTQSVLTIMAAVTAFLGSCLGISSHIYYQKQETAELESEFIEEE